MTETTPSLPASGHGEVAGLVEELRVGLKGVTPGPWKVVGGCVTDFDREYPCSMSFEFMPNGEAGEGDQRSNAAHIARCSPDNIAKLLDHIDALTAQLAAPTPSPVGARADGVRELLVAEAQFCRESLEAISDEANAHPSNQISVRYHWQQRLTLAERYLAALESTPAQPVRKAAPKPFSTYPEDHEKLLRLSRTIQGHNVDDEDRLRAADTLSDLVIAILKDEEQAQPDPAAEIAELFDFCDRAWLAADDASESEVRDVLRSLIAAVTTKLGSRPARAASADRGQEEKGK